MDNKKTKINEYINSKKIGAFFNKFIYDTKKITNKEDALILRKKLIISGIITFLISIILLTSCILSFIFLQLYIITAILTAISFILLLIGCYLMYVGFIILIAGVASKQFKEENHCPYCFANINKEDKYCSNCQKEL